jgi:polysaccharide deacetylase family protein (PEP-CTERM system associated)
MARSEARSSPGPVHTLTVDVEEYFQVQAFVDRVPPETWDTLPSRVVQSTRRVLDLFDRYGARGTFFFVGWVAARYPSLVREVQARGHELACHSYWHRPVYALTPDEFRADLREAKEAIEQAAGTRIRGYRAPTWSITRRSLWALDILAEEGFEYDSSIFPIRHDLYGMPHAPRLEYTHELRSGRRLREFPPTTASLFGANLPGGGGGYLRILPFSYTRWVLRRMEEVDGAPAMVYFHPWELDPGQPRIAASLRSRLRHYTNLGRMEDRLARLLEGYRFQSIAERLGAPRSCSADPDAPRQESVAPPVVSFVVPVRDDAARLRLCLQSIAANRHEGGATVEVVVADNGSEDESVRVARDSGARVLELPGLRVSTLRNRAAQFARGKILIFCDADNLVSADWVRVGMELLSDSAVAGVGAPYDPPSPPTWVQRCYDAMRDHRPGTRLVRWLGSGNMAVRSSVFLEVGGFDEALETCEDVDLCRRLRSSGYRLLSDDRLRNVHLGDPATLRELFRSELWRGRDNLRVSLRGGLTTADVPGIAVPLIDLALLGLSAIGVASAAGGGLLLVGSAVGAFAALAALRAGRIVMHDRGSGLLRAPQALAFACTYDLARALALVARWRHHRRHEERPRPTVAQEGGP